MKTCPYCAEPIQDAAIVCKHCHRDLRPRVDPLLAPVAGKSTGEITVVGYLGIGMGLLISCAAIYGVSAAGPDQAGGAMFLLLVGVGSTIASYLWVRR